MSRIVALVSSPQVGGNTDYIVGAILDGAMGLSTNEIVLYRLDKLRFAHGCRACRGCKNTGRCVQNDEVTDILEDIRGSDVVIASSPLYFGGCASQYKVLEDRMYSFFDRESKSDVGAGKKAILVMSCSYDGEASDRVLNHMAGVYEAMGFEVLDKVMFMDDRGRKKARDDGILMKRMRALGTTLRNT